MDNYLSSGFKVSIYKEFFERVGESDCRKMGMVSQTGQSCFYSRSKAQLRTNSAA